MHNPSFAQRSTRRVRRLRDGCAGLLLAVLAVLPAAQAARPASVATSVDATRADARVQALQRAGDAVVALQVTATEVLTQDDRRLPARQVAYDLATGFALVRPLVPLRGIEPVPLAGVAELQPGEPLLAAVGGSGGAEVAFTRLVATRPFSGNWEYHIDVALFTSPPIANHSGASLFNRDGELLGIGSLLVREAAGPDRALPGNMFVPVELLRPVLAEMQSTGRTRASVRPWLGLSSLVRDGHVQIVRVDRSGPALEAGLQPGDVVLAIDGVEVNTLEAFYKQLWQRPAADAVVELTVRQGLEVRRVKVHAIDRMQRLRKPEGI